MNEQKIIEATFSSFILTILKAKCLISWAPAVLLLLMAALSLISLARTCSHEETVDQTIF